MNKLRCDSVFGQLTAEQSEKLEGWLMEEGVGYKEARERMQKEFGVTASPSGLARHYQRLMVKRSQAELVAITEACRKATWAANPPGTMQAGLITVALKRAFEVGLQSRGSIREFTGLLRAVTSAQSLEMKRIEFQRWEDLKAESERMRERVDERKRQLLEEAARKEKREARKAQKEAEQAAEVGHEDRGSRMEDCKDKTSNIERPTADECGNEAVPEGGALKAGEEAIKRGEEMAKSEDGAPDISG